MSDSPQQTGRPTPRPPASPAELGRTRSFDLQVADEESVTDSIAPGPSTSGDSWSPPPVECIGDYTVLRVLGEGGMGTVYLAEDARLGRKAAIKTMRAELAAKPQNRERFLREARAAAALEHDNVVPIWQVSESADGSPFIVMPFLQGEMLADRLKRQPVSNVGLILKVACEVAEALAAAHAKGLIHRDIKPANLWLEGDPAAKELRQQIRRCKVLDFGLARSAESDDVQITASGAILGTPAFMAPEQARGEKVDARADLFSLGVMLYRMATGKLPFNGPTAMAMLTALATVDPPSVGSRCPNLPKALSDLIDRLMSKDAAKRPQSAAAVAATVKQIVKELQAKKSAPAVQAVQPATEAFAPAASSRVHDTAAKASKQAAKSGRGRVLLLAALAVLLALVPLGLWLASVILRVETDKGTLVVEIEDDAVEARVKGGKLILSGPDGKDRYTLTPAERDKKLEAGSYRIRVEGVDGLAVDTPEFTLKKGDRVTVRVRLEPKAVAKQKEPIVEGFLDKDGKNSIGMKFVRIPKGKFTMGSPKNEKDRGKDEDEHEVEITKDFYLGVHEVTQGQFREVMGFNPSHFSHDGKEATKGKYFDYSKPRGSSHKVKRFTQKQLDDFPVENVSWEDAKAFLEKLNARAAEKEKGRKYRLPTEAEWEYACRGGVSSKKYHTGDSLSKDDANFNNDLGRTSKVGSYAANQFGLHDVHGNVWEWCEDFYDAKYYANSPLRDPLNLKAGSGRVGRGSGWFSAASTCRSAYRFGLDPGDRGLNLGFRVALVPVR